MSFGQAGHRKQQMEGVHCHSHYPCTWQGCTHQAHTKTLLKYHVRRAHTKEWSLECQAKKHPVEWGEEQEVYRRENPFVCKYKKCLNRYKTEVEKHRHKVKMH